MHGRHCRPAATAQQGVANVATGRPITEGLAQTAVAGGIQGALGGAWTGRHPAEVTPEVVAPHPFAEERGSLLPKVAPVTREGVLRPGTPEPSSLTATSLGTEARQYERGPIVTRGTERTTFTPSELAEQAGTLTGRTPEELAAAAAKLQPPMDFTQRRVFLNSDEVQRAEIERAQVARAVPLEAHSDKTIEQRSAPPVRTPQEGEQALTEEESNAYLDRVINDVEARHQSRAGEIGLSDNHPRASVSNWAQTPRVPPPPPERFSLALKCLSEDCSGGAKGG